MIINTSPFFALIIQQWRRLLLGLTCSVLCVIASVALLSLSGWLICAAAISGWASVHALAFNYFLPAAAIRFLALLRIGSRYAERMINHNVTFSILRDLRTQFYRRLEPLAPLHLTHFGSGDLLQRMVNDVDDLNNRVLRIGLPLLSSVVLLIVLFVSLHYFFALFSLIACGGFVLMLACTMLIGHILGRHCGAKMIEQLSQLRSFYIVSLQSAVDIKVFGLSVQRQQQFLGMLNQLSVYQRQFGSRQGILSGLMLLILGGLLVLLLDWGVVAVAHHTLKPAVLGVLVLLLMAAYEVVAPLPLASQFYGRTQAASSRFNAIHQRQPAVVFNQSHADATTGFDLKIQQLSFQYPKSQRVLLTNLNLTIAEGARLVIAGETGSGKSSLAYLLCRCFDPCSGAIRLGGVDLNQYSEAALRKRIVLVKQQTHIFNANVRENLKLANPQCSDARLWAVLEAVDLAEVIKRSRQGLDTELGDFGQAFSGGQIKRIGIARALLAEAKIIVFDEPSEGLDAATFQRCWQQMQPWLIDKTVIVMTHQAHLLESMDNYFYFPTSE